MKYDSLRQEIALCAKRLFDAGLMTPLGGNVSIRLPGANSFLITPTGVHKGSIQPQDLVIVDSDGNYHGGKPSVETCVHRAIYAEVPTVNAIVHTHSPLTLATAAFQLQIKPKTMSGGSLLPIIKIPPLAHGSEELADQVSSSACQSKVLLLEAHGVLAMGGELIEAEDAVFSLEMEAKLCLLERMLLSDLPELAK